jgi:pimeloyl-ACP methyl ester carboxylesterase
MGGYVEIGALNTWYDEQGEGEPLVLLEGCAPTQHGLPRCRRLVRTFGSSHRSAAVMGTTPDLEGALSYDVMSADTIGFLDAIVGGPAYLVGWSDGGIVGLLVAIARPDLVRKLVVIAANFDTAGLTPEAMEWFTTISADSDDLAMLRECYLATSPDGPGTGR